MNKTETEVLLTYEDKLLLTKMRIQQWYEYYDGNVVVSFSGGKDSTVLLHIVRLMYPDVKCVFSDTGMEYPEIRNFVKTIENVEWVKPSRTFRDVLFNEGYPVVSKKVSEQIKRLRKGTTEKNKISHNLIRTGYSSKGIFIPSRKLSNKWKYLEKEANFLISDKCCDIFKKNPLKNYYKTHKLYPMTGMMKSEGGQRALAYSKCNLYDSLNPISNPLFKWTNNDIWLYIYENKVRICNIYFDRMVNGKKIKGENRTGCMFCMYGVHLEKGENRFQRMKNSHPKMYDYCIKKLKMGDVLDFLKVKY